MYEVFQAKMQAKIFYIELGSRDDPGPFNGLESSSLIRLEEGQEYRPGYDTPPCQRGETLTYPERFVSGCKTLSLK